MNWPNFGMGQHDIGIGDPIIQLFWLSSTEGDEYCIRVTRDKDLRVPFDILRRLDEVGLGGKGAARQEQEDGDGGGGADRRPACGSGAPRIVHDFLLVSRTCSSSRSG